MAEEAPAGSADPFAPPQVPLDVGGRCRRVRAADDGSPLRPVSTSALAIRSCAPCPRWSAGRARTATASGRQDGGRLTASDARAGAAVSCPRNVAATGSVDGSPLPGDRAGPDAMIGPMTYELGQGTGPLNGVKVVEIAGLGPGPHACMILADLGADVVRIERPGGQPLAGGPQNLLNRGRPSVALDLKQPRATETVLELVERADLLVEGMRPGVAERLGLGPEQCHARNPRLVYGRMTGWGQEGPLAQHRRSRHELHLGRRRAARAGPGQGAAALPQQPRRRLRRRLDVPRHRAAGRPARGAAERAGAGGRRRDRRRHRPPQRDDRRVPRRRRLHRGAREQPPRRGRAVLRPLRDRRRQAHVGRRAGAAVLRPVRRAARHQGRRPPTASTRRGPTSCAA